MSCSDELDGGTAVILTTGRTWTRLHSQMGDAHSKDRAWVRSGGVQIALGPAKMCGLGWRDSAETGVRGAKTKTQPGPTLTTAIPLI
jgi:hypothetical protein